MGGEEGRWIKGSLVLFPFFPYFSNFFAYYLTLAHGLWKEGQTVGSILKNRGKHAKLKKEGQTSN
jgi:hypothetical protein